ncbi:hypothetical protein GCM10022198_13360 [Klugiella xanthotipulae]|uniref:Uncharacterized protein n=1 Tax=Klugiella xanthotipulae TaxID=244735 RepID=A0A543I4A3_9MICO|nr:hypothetical protein [Klugiella xanthotipulae]TQM65422.1 hypothetical protein FB466_0224 [Klugiella xanthotipulae]
MLTLLLTNPLVIGLLGAATTAPVAVDNEDVTPGAVGFLATAFVALMAVLLGLDMMRRVRRTRYRAEVGALLDAEEAQARGETVESADPTASVAPLVGSGEPVSPADSDSTPR